MQENTEKNVTSENMGIPLLDRLNYDRLTFYYLSMPIVLFSNFIGALLLSVIQINVVDIYSIKIWLLVSFIVFLYGLYENGRFKKLSEEEKLRNSDIWFDKYYTYTLINGIIWGSSAFLLFPTSSLLNQMILIFFLLAIGFAAMGILASKIELLLTYILVTYIPLVMRLFFLEDAFYNNVSYTILTLILVMIIMSNYYGKVINSSLSNRQEFISIRHTHEKLKERFFSLFERAPVAIYYYNRELELEDVNSHYMVMNKVKEKKELVGKSIYDVNNAQIIKIHEDVFSGKTANYRGPFRAINKADLFVQLSTVPMMDKDNNVAGGIMIINDITSEVTAKEKMLRNAYYDLLTNIPNRTLLMDKLKSFISNMKTNDIYAGICVLDIDDFKKVNEHFGHDVGDELLKQIVLRVEEVIDSSETFARVSGKKFVIFIPNLDKNKSIAEEKILTHVEKIRNHFKKPLVLAGEDYHLTFTTGMILFNEDDSSAYDLLKKAEIALYQAKNNTRGTNQFYQSDMSTEVKEQLMLKNDMHTALSNNEFSMYYQAQFDVHTNTINGAEALVRWKHPTKGFISPAKFIPVAEESGLIIQLEEWIFDKIMQDIKKLSEQAKGFTLKHIAINVSVIHFLQPYFVEHLMMLIHKYNINPNWIELEITESAVMRNVSDTINKIKMLKDFGFTFSIDDFGTGYSSLSYLKELPIDTLKIDQSFVLEMDNDKDNAMIVESIVSIGQKFNLIVLAEGVENAEVLSYLKEIKCDTYQGYYGAKPEPFDRFLERII
jgi:diguanylate cyclase (GGDEF)-like protein